MRSITTRCIVATLGVILYPTGPLRAAVTIFVTTTADSGPGSLRQAIADSSSGDEIRFLTNGVISLLSGELQITNNLTIIGPGATNLAVSGSGSSRVFNISAGITGNISGLTIRDGRTTNGASAVGSGASGTAGGSGGGVYNLGILTLNDCIITANTTGNGGDGRNGTDSVGASGSAGGSAGSGGHGGGFYNRGVLTLRNCVLTANRAGNGGRGGNGGAGGYNGTSAPRGGAGGASGSGGFGGAIFNSGVISLNACMLSENHTGNGGDGSMGGNGGYCPPCRPGLGVGAPGSNGSGGAGGGGAGIWNEQGTVTATNCTFDRNFCGVGGTGVEWFGPAGPGGSGGGIGNNGSFAISRTALIGNAAGLGGVVSTNFGPAGNGGGIFNGNNGNLALSLCTLSGNTAFDLVTYRSGGNGGGVFNGSNSTATISACTLSGNVCGNGGGIFNTGLLSVVSSTVVNNSAYYGEGGGIYSSFHPFNGGYTNSSLGNSLIANNSPYDISRYFASEGHNLIGVKGYSLSGLRSNSCNCDLVGTITNRIDPLLGPLQDNGGPVFTHSLLTGSPAIDAGISTGLPFDTRGQPRTIDHPAVTNAFGGDGTDIGALEVNHILTGTETRRARNDILVRFTTVSDKTYGVEFRPEVGDGLWTELPGVIDGTGGIVTYTDAEAANLPRRFYRVFERSTP